MTVNEVFTDQEDKISEQIKSIIFYSKDNVLSDIKGTLKPVEKERAADILETTLSQIGFEQKQRRDYVLSSMAIDAEKAKVVDADIFVRAIGAYGNNPAEIERVASSAKLDSSVFKPSEITNESLEQATSFNQVASNLDDLFSSSLYEKRIRPLVMLLNKLPSDRLSSVVTQTKDYIQRVQQLGDEIIQKNPDFSNAMKQLFALTGLSIISNKKETIGEKLGFCGDLLLAAGILDSSKKQEKELTDEQIAMAAGTWLYNLEGSPLAEDILAD